MDHSLTQIDPDKYILDPEFPEQRRFFVLTRHEAELWGHMSQDQKDGLIARKKEEGEFFKREFGQTVEDWLKFRNASTEE